MNRLVWPLFTWLWMVLIFQQQQQQILGIKTMSVNINVKTPLNRTKFGRSTVEDALGVNVTFPLNFDDQINSNNFTKHFHSKIYKPINFYNRKHEPNHNDKFVTRNNQYSASTEEKPVIDDNQLLNPDKKFLADVENAKKTDVSVTIYHHRLFQDPHNEGKKKIINTYGNGFGLHYGFDLDGNYTREKGYQFEKGLQEEICSDKNECNDRLPPPPLISLPDYHSDEKPTEYALNNKLKKHIISVVHNNNNIITEDPELKNTVFLTIDPKRKYIRSQGTSDVMTLFKSRMALDADKMSSNLNARFKRIRPGTTLSNVYKPFRGHRHWPSESRQRPKLNYSRPRHASSGQYLPINKDEFNKLSSQIKSKQIHLNDTNYKNHNNYVDHSNISNNKIHHHWYIGVINDNDDDDWNDNNRYLEMKIIKNLTVKPNENPYSLNLIKK